MAGFERAELLEKFRAAMERLPVERALTEQVRKFKAIGVASAPVTGG